MAYFFVNNFIENYRLFNAGTNGSLCSTGTCLIISVLYMFVLKQALYGK